MRLQGIGNPQGLAICCDLWSERWDGEDNVLWRSRQELIRPHNLWISATKSLPSGQRECKWGHEINHNYCKNIIDQLLDHISSKCEIGHKRGGDRIAYLACGCARLHIALWRSAAWQLYCLLADSWLQTCHIDLRMLYIKCISKRQTVYLAGILTGGCCMHHIRVRSYTWHINILSVYTCRITITRVGFNDLMRV